MHLTNGAAFSAAATAFDRVADSYDELFTHTAIGMAQRKQVWGKLIAAFLTGSRILELNCGTGEDARFLAARGRSVVACDASTEMIEVAKRHNSGDGRLTTHSGFTLRLRSVLVSSSKPSTIVHPSAQKEEMGARFALPSSLADATIATGVPK